MIGMIEWYLTTQVIVSISNRSFANVIIWFRLVCIIKEVSTIIYQVLKLVLGNKENSSWQCMTNKIIFIAAYRWPVPYTCILRYLKKKVIATPRYAHLLLILCLQCFNGFKNILNIWSFTLNPSKVSKTRNFRIKRCL